MINLYQSSCILCGSEKRKIISSFSEPDQYESSVGIGTEDYERHWVACGLCNFHYSTYSRDPVVLDRIYEQVYRGQSAPWRIGSTKQIFEKVIKIPAAESETHYRIEWIKTHIAELAEMGLLSFPSKSRTVLDIGGATGVFAHLFKDEEWNSEIVDPSEEGIFLEKEYGIPYYAQSYGLGKLEKNYDLISLIFVLEHMHDPQAMLTKVHANLSKKSIIYIEVPDALSFELKDHSDDIFNSCHLWMFDPKSMINLTNKCGFEMLRLQRAHTYRGHYSLMYLGIAK